MTFSHQVYSDLRQHILLLNEDIEEEDIPGFMITSDGITRQLFFHGKVFYCDICHSKHTFHEGFLSENREQQNLPEATPEIHQDAENPSKKNEVEQNDVALGQPIAQEGGAEATSRQK